ncbi:MAG TPA: PA domain-containing protein, partial [Acidobacteriota bacterium]|nr:PA domain-containing protein [Acidobacteriota bacterium]
MRLRNISYFILFLFCAVFAAAAVDAQKPMLGFSSEAQSAQQRLEAQFDSYLKTENLREWMRRFTAHPHHVGSPYGKQVAETIESMFRSWGFETEIKEYRVLFPTPKQRIVELEEPSKFQARLREPAINEDATSGQAAEQLPVYNAYSIDGDVTAPLVYVNYGIPKDYEELERRGIDVRGKIVIARYGASWRGIKPKVAAEYGAIGCI